MNHEFNSPPVAMRDIMQAWRNIRAQLPVTPLRHSPFLSELTGADVWLKLENWQPTGSFKVRGALHKMCRLATAGQQPSLVTASAGNHGLGMAFAARALQFGQLDIFVPESAPPPKLARLRRFPVALHLRGGTYDAAHAAAAAYATARGAQEISAYDDADIIAGQGTVALEILADLPQTDTMLVPIGGGGLLAGVTVACRALQPACRILGVQPEASPAALLSYRQGEPLDPFAHQPTIADGLAGGFGRLPFQLTHRRPPAVTLVSEAALRRAVYRLLVEEQLVIEPAGAAAVAPLLAGLVDLRHRTVVCILTGGNLDSRLLAPILAEFGGIS